MTLKTTWVVAALGTMLIRCRNFSSNTCCLLAVDGTIRRVPAVEIEGLVIRSVRERLKLSQSVDDRLIVNTHVVRVEVQREQLIIQLAQVPKKPIFRTREVMSPFMFHGRKCHPSGAVRFS